VNVSGIAIVALLSVVVYQRTGQSEKSDRVLRARSLELVDGDGSVLALSRSSEGGLRIGNRYGEFEIQLSKRGVGISLRRADERGSFVVNLEKWKVNELFLENKGRRGFSVELEPSRTSARVLGPKSGGVAMVSEKGNSYFTAVGHKDESVFYLGSTPGQMGSQLAIYGEEENRPFLVARSGDNSGGGFGIRGRDGGGFQVNVIREGTVLRMLRGDRQSGVAIKSFGTAAVTVDTCDEKGNPVDWLKSPGRDHGK